VRCTFKLGLNNRDKELLNRIAKFFGVGKVYTDGARSIQYVVQTVKDLEVIISHFDNYPLITQKKGDYILFKEALSLVKNKDHLTKEGLQEIINIKASLGFGLSEEILNNFPHTTPVVRPVVSCPDKFDPYWVSGFVDGDGCFMIRTIKSSSYKLGYSTFLGFSIHQDVRDFNLMMKFEDFFNCGGISLSSDKESCEYYVYKTQDILEKIIPFFVKYPLQSTKSLDFKDFCEASNIIRNKGHLTEEGFDRILEIKSFMNKNRYS
jgi:hypothetical protein